MRQRIRARFSRPVAAVVQPLLHGMLGIGKIDQIYDAASDLDVDENFAAKILQAMRIDLQLGEDQIDRIPKEGPLVVVANHPFGGIEGVALLALLKRVRPDVKLMANYVLGMIPALRNDFIFVDPFGGKGSVQNNITGMRDSLRWLKDGHCLGIFPAGEVSSFQPGRGAVADVKWADAIGRIIQKAKCDVSCIYFDGRNSRLFQMLGMVNSRLRTLMLPRETARKKNHPLVVKVGHVVPAEKTQTFETAPDLMDYLRMRTYVLSAGGRKDRQWKKRRKQRLERLKRRQRLERLAPPVEPDILVAELHALSDEEVLLESGIYRVYCARAENIPNTLAELGRLREETFRAVGEGTGQASDIDWWDQHYRHLILWNDEDKDIIGSYRMGLTDELLEKFGRRGLYTTTLFEYSDRVLDTLTPAVELGRSFVQKKYQKSHVSLGLLWKGIAAFVYRNPLHSKLFGPVSISNEYHSMSKQILVEFIKDHHFDDDLANGVHPAHPLKIKPVKLWNHDHEGSVLRKIGDVDELIAEIEPHMKNAPVLIRQYLRLNGKFLAFNVDPDFSDSLDALILCDLADATVVGKRYMGKDKFAEFLEKRKTMMADRKDEK